MSTVATVTDLQTFMAVTLDETRAQQMLDLTEQLASSVVAPLPPGSLPVILRIAARAFPNPSGTSAESQGGASASWSPSGLTLTRSDRRDLQRAAGIGGGAFSVSTAPCAGKGYRDPLRPATLDDREQFALDQDLP